VIPVISAERAIESRHTTLTAVKAVILAGGLGSRLSEETTVKPKPMVEVGGMPILWHIMKIYAAHGVEEFVVCLGYKGYVIKEWFANYALHTSDVTFDMRTGEMEVHHSTTEPWRVTCVETGDETMTGGRLKRVLPHVGGETFCLTYGDGVADVDVTALVAHHRDEGRLATVTAVQPPGRFGALEIAGSRVDSFAEKPRGVITIEFPHLLRLIELNQWDTIYHEHFSYLSLATAGRVFAAHGLRLFDVEELPTHGGSLRIFGCHDDDPRERTGAVRELAERERAAGLETAETYLRYGERVVEDKRQILSFLIELKRAGASIAGYGAAAKGNTLLNFCGAGRDFIDFTCDASPHKQGRLLPGTHIPILAPDAIRERRPDVVLIVPWNIKEELMGQLSYIREWGGRFAARAPELRLVG
jgi:glucose-1-phosphate cytidylyltransferase